VNCITIETAKSLPEEDLGVTSQGKAKKLWVTKFDIDIGKCCYCGLCVYPCPTVCIFMTDVFEFSEYNREDLIYRYANLSPAEAAEKTANAERVKAEAEAKKQAALEAKKKAAAAEAAAKKAAESASADSTAGDGNAAGSAPADETNTTDNG
jgi:NADH-quinone oxidoreductase subunit I